MNQHFSDLCAQIAKKFREVEIELEETKAALGLCRVAMAMAERSLQNDYPGPSDVSRQPNNIQIANALRELRTGLERIKQVSENVKARCEDI